MFYFGGGKLLSTCGFGQEPDKLETVDQWRQIFLQSGRSGE